MSYQHQWPGPPPPPPSERQVGVETDPMPSWGSDLRNMVLKAIFCAVLLTILMLLSGTGLLHTNNRNTVQADGLWAGILASLGPVFWAYLLLRFGRADNGFRTKGLPGLMLFGVVFGVLIQITSMLVWPLVVDKAEHGNSVIAMYASDVLAFALAAVFVIAMFAWCSLCMVGFAAERLAVGFAGTGALVVVAGVGTWQGIRIFENPATEDALLMWAAIAALGLILLPIVAALATRRKHVSTPGYLHASGGRGDR